MCVCVCVCVCVCMCVCVCVCVCVQKERKRLQKEEINYSHTFLDKGTSLICKRKYPRKSKIAQHTQSNESLFLPSLSLFLSFSLSLSLSLSLFLSLFLISHVNKNFQSIVRRQTGSVGSVRSDHRLEWICSEWNRPPLVFFSLSLFLSLPLSLSLSMRWFIKESKNIVMTIFSPT